MHNAYRVDKRENQFKKKNDLRSSSSSIFGPAELFVNFLWTFCETLVKACAFSRRPSLYQDIEVLAIVLAMTGKFAIAIAFGLIYLYTCELYPTIIRWATGVCVVIGHVVGLNKEILAASSAIFFSCKFKCVMFLVKEETVTSSCDIFHSRSPSWPCQWTTYAILNTLSTFFFVGQSTKPTGQAADMLLYRADGPYLCFFINIFICYHFFLMNIYVSPLQDFGCGQR